MRPILKLIFCFGMFITFEVNAQNQFVEISQTNFTDGPQVWRSVGRLNIGNTGFCTASLVANDVVITAAHCLFDKYDGTPVPIDSLEFHVGYRDGHALAYRGIKRVVLHPSYDITEYDLLGRVGNDIALLELDNPIQTLNTMKMSERHQSAVGDVMQIVSYSKQKANAPSFENACHMLARDNKVLMFDCTVDHGASGAPIFIQDGDNHRLVSVVSAKANWQGREVSLAAAMETDLERLLTAYYDSANTQQRIATIEY